MQTPGASVAAIFLADFSLAIPDKAFTARVEWISPLSYCHYYPEEDGYRVYNIQSHASWSKTTKSNSGSACKKFSHIYHDAL